MRWEADQVMVSVGVHILTKIGVWKVEVNKVGVQPPVNSNPAIYMLSILHVNELNK